MKYLPISEGIQEKKAPKVLENKVGEFRRKRRGYTSAS